MKRTAFFNKYKTIVAFLILEVMALVCFTFANINEVLYIISTVLSIDAFVFAFFTNVDRKDFIKMAPVVGGLFIISGLAAFGGFSHSFATFSNIATFFAIPAFFSLGFFARRVGDLKTEYFVLAIGFGLAAITLIGTITTWVQYGLFFSEIHKAKPVYFYEGVAYNIRKEMGWLMGFKITEVSQDYGGMFAILCATFLPALLFIKPKENKRLFISTAVIGAIGLISILSIPNWKALIFLGIASLFALGFKLFRSKKIVSNVLLYVTVGITGIGVLFFILTLVNGATGFKFPGILDKVMHNNFIMRPTEGVLTAAFAKDLSGSLYNLIGFDLTSGSAPVIGLNGIVETPTLIFEYEVIKEVGIVGLVFVLALFATMFVFVVRYLKTSKDSAFVKNAIVVMLVAFMLYATFGYDVKIQPHNLDIYEPFLRSVPFMVCLFLFGFTYYAPDKKEQPEVSKVEEASL